MQLIQHGVKNHNAIRNLEDTPEFELSKDNTYPAYMGEIWDVFWRILTDWGRLGHICIS